VGERGDGVRAVLAAQREREVKPPRLRAFIAWIEKDGRLGLFRYEPALVPRTGERRLIEALVESGFVMAAVSRAEGARLVADAAIKSQGAGERLPRHYWLARDLLGLYDAHRRRPRRSGDGRERLARAI